MVPIGAIHDKSDRESDFRVIPKIREDKTLFSMGLSNARLGVMQIWKRTKKTAFPILERFRDYSKSRNRSKTTAA